MGKMTDGCTNAISLRSPEQTSWRHSTKWLVSLAVAVLLVSGWAIHLLLRRPTHLTNAPQAIAISACPESTPGVRHIRDDFLGIRGVRFDAPDDVFTVSRVVRDAPPETLYVVTMKSANAKIVVSPDQADFKCLEITYPVFSEHVEKRYIRDLTGRVFGTDSWGYLHTGERWRYTRFSTGDAVGYEPTPPNQADQLDRLVNSACFPRNENRRK
jgi:hypothetical protein